MHLLALKTMVSRGLILDEGSKVGGSNWRLHRTPSYKILWRLAKKHRMSGVGRLKGIDSWGGPFRGTFRMVGRGKKLGVFPNHHSKIN